LPPNPGFTKCDPAIGLEPVTEKRHAPLTHVMSNSFGFGGNNGVLIFSKPETIPHTRAPKKIQIAVGGIGVIGPGAVTIKEISPPLPPVVSEPFLWAAPERPTESTSSVTISITRSFLRG